MPLSQEQIRKLITEGANRGAIERAIYHQNRIKFHAETRVSAYNIMQPITEFLAFVQNVLPHDKFKLFKELFRYPVKTNEVTGICFDKLSRIFDGRNPAYNYQFAGPEQKEDWEAYRTRVLNEPKVWETVGWEHFKTEINSILVIDCPAEQVGTLPEPYFYWLPIEQVITYKAHPSGFFDYLIFRQKGKIAVIDRDSYQLYEDKNGNIGGLIAEQPHDLGYCPARFFWNESVSLREPDVKASPLTKELEALDWYLFYYISKKHLDLFGSYPIYSGYEQACNFSNEENGDYCDGGYLRDKQGRYRIDRAGQLMLCPKCGNHRIIGAGSFVEIPIPDGNKQPDLRNPVQMLSVDRNSLDYNVAEIERLKNEIITAVVGTTEEVTAREALNEQQVQANFESQTTVLARVKKGFEEAQKFVDETICRLRYGSAFIAASINYGTEFYLSTVTQLREQYAAAKDSGASEAELDSLQEQIMATEYRSNPEQLQRMKILAELEPFRHLTRAEAMELHGKGLMTGEDLVLKMNFSALIRRFERENIDVREFGSELPYNVKIGRISEVLRGYAREGEQSPSINT